MSRLKGLSIIEILIALIVFGAGILVILRTLGANILFVDRVWLRSQATFLAQENLELLFTHRMDNYKIGNRWDCVEIDCSNTIGSGDAKYVNFYLTQAGYSFEISETLEDLSPFQMSIKNGFWTKGNRDIKGTRFYRYLSFAPFRSEADKEFLPLDEIKNVISLAMWEKGSYTGYIKLQTFITDWR